MESPFIPMHIILLNNSNMNQHQNQHKPSQIMALLGMAIAQSTSQSMKSFGVTIT